MAIDLSGIPDAPSSNIDLSGIPDEPKVDLSGIPDAAPQEDSLTRLEDNPFSLMTDPIKAVTGSSMYDRAMQDVNSPQFMQSKTAPFDKYIPQARQAAKNRLVGGGLIDQAAAPINYTPLPVGKAVGAVVSHLAEAGNPLFEGIAKWAAQHLPNLAPNVASSAAEMAGNSDVMNIIQKSAEPAPVAPPPDEAPAYQAWLQQNAQSATPENPMMSVPLHPAEDARAALADLQPKDNIVRDEQGQPLQLNPIEQSATPVKPKVDPQELLAVMKDKRVGYATAREMLLNPVEAVKAPLEESPLKPFTIPKTGRQLGFRELLNPATKDAVPAPALQETPFESPVGPARDQGQQQFDFTQGPKAPAPKPVQPPQNPLADLRARLRDPNISDAEFDSVQKQIRQLTEEARVPTIDLKAAQAAADAENQAVEAAAKPVNRAPKNVIPKESPEIKAIRARKLELLNKADDMTPAEEQEYAAINRALVSKKNVAQPSALEDLGTIIGGLNEKGSTSGGRLTPEAKAALERWKTEHAPEIAQHLKIAGNDVAGYVAKNMPALSETQAKQAVRLLSQHKIENLNLRQYPDEQKQQLRDIFAGQEEKLKTKPMTHEQVVDKAKDITSHPITEPILRNSQGQLAAEKVSRQMTDIAKMKAISEDKTLSATDTMKKLIEVDTLKDKKISSELGLALNSGKIPLEAHQEKLDALRTIIKRLSNDPKLSSAESQGLISKMRTQFPELDQSTTPAEVFKTVFRNFITSGPLTLGVNAISGYGNIAGRPAMRALEVSAAKVRALLTGKPTSATYKELGAMLKGMDAALRKGEKLPDSLKAKTFSDKYNVSPFATMAATAKSKIGRAALDVADKVITAPEKIMRKTDDHVKNVFGMMEKYAAEARGENVFSDQHVIDRITSAQSRLSFQDSMSNIGKWVAQTRNYWSHQEPTAANQALDILTYSVQPFIQTVDRIIAGGWNSSILGSTSLPFKAMAGKYTGALSKLSRNEMSGEKLDRDIASAMVGIPLFIWTGVQLANGKLTGSAPSNAAGREAFNNSGKTEQAFKVGDRWVPLRLLPEPISTAIQINLALHQGFAEAKDKSQGMMVGALKAVQKTGYMLATKPYLGGMNSLITSMSAPKESSSSEDDDLISSVNKNPLVKKVLPSVAVPSIVKDIGVVKDTMKGKPRVMADTAVEALKRRAGATGNMTPELNTFGEEVTHPMMGKVNNKPSYALAEKFPPQPVDRTIDGVKLSQQEYYNHKKSIGEQRKQVYETLSSSKTFMDSPKGIQQIIVEDMIAEADKVGGLPEKIREVQSDPLYYNRKLRTILEIQKPGGERHFPYLK